jgi:hypothetical protein
MEREQRPEILRFVRPPSPAWGDRPWATFAGFAGWADSVTPRSDPDGLRGVRAGCGMAGSLGLLARALLASFDPANDPDDVIRTIGGEVARSIMAASILADEVGYNPLRTLTRPVGDYLIPFDASESEPVPWDGRGAYSAHAYLQACNYMLPVQYAVAIDRFTMDGLRRDQASEMLLKGVHELQTLADAYDLPLETCLERQVRTVKDDLDGRPPSEEDIEE